LPGLGIQVERVAPSAPSSNHVVGILKDSLSVDLSAFLTNYPLWAKYPEADVIHLTSQNLASMLMIRKPRRPTIVTVHDIIPYMLRSNRDLSAYRGTVDRRFDQLAMHGLRRADQLVADSEYTKRCLVEHLRIDPGRIEVVHLGIDHKRFRPVRPTPEIYQRYGLPVNRKYLIYVGSEDPRKNLRTLLRAMALAQKEHHDIHLMKVGSAHYREERAALVALATRLGIHASVHFLDDVPEQDLAELYALADVCVMPSLFEGFGFPVLEAMACGTPVVCCNAASLPELAGQAALMFNAGRDAEYRLASAICSVLSNRQMQRQMTHSGFEQAARFTWDRTSDQMIDVYKRTQLAYGHHRLEIRRGQAT
jgi:glycosyltransferase involved in cell wall biosynthesis